MSTDLKPCPFCGSATTLDDERLLWVASCTGCGACVLGDRAPEPEQEMPAAYWEPFRQSAVDRWNRRAALAQPEPVVLTRPDCFEFAMDFLGGKEEAEVRNYIERLESAASVALAQPVAPTDEELEDLAEVMNVSGNPVPAMRRALELWGNSQGILDSSPQPQPPSGYAYRYPDGIRFNDGRNVNGCRPSEVIPYWFRQLPATALPTPEATNV
jgi:hypothetical protein